MFPTQLLNVPNVIRNSQAWNWLTTQWHRKRHQLSRLTAISFMRNGTQTYIYLFAQLPFIIVVLLPVIDNCLNRIIVILLEAKHKLATSTSGRQNELGWFRLPARLPLCFEWLTACAWALWAKEWLLSFDAPRNDQTSCRVLDGGRTHARHTFPRLFLSMMNANKFPEARKTAEAKQWNNMSQSSETETNLFITGKLPCNAHSTACLCVCVCV